MSAFAIFMLVAPPTAVALGLWCSGVFSPRPPTKTPGPALPASTTQRLPAAPSVPEPFTAYVTCPHCETYEVHAMRRPRPAPTRAELAAWERNRTVTTVEAFGGTELTRYDPPPPVDESMFEVIRVCRCGHEWGQV